MPTLARNNEYWLGRASFEGWAVKKFLHFQRRPTLSVCISRLYKERLKGRYLVSVNRNRIQQTTYLPFSLSLCCQNWNSAGAARRRCPIFPLHPADMTTDEGLLLLQQMRFIVWMCKDPLRIGTQWISSARSCEHPCTALTGN